MLNTIDFSLNALQVSGQLDDHLQSWDALRAALPVGTVSGAPKVKSCFMYPYLEILSKSNLHFFFYFCL
jgi:hypothetical protein